MIEDKINFYELGHIRQLKETLVFEPKHFHDDLKGWEEKNEVQTFKLVKLDGNRFYFDGFTFEKSVLMKSISMDRYSRTMAVLKK
ncbi:MAG: DUF6265 family protein [Saonia sp.]